ncbi:diguanylate cyclase [Luteimonas sp. gir]|uniref:sensor domain-containing diguanylate cyclase n=1 Tax=Luteimonas sp. gir TaxID=3127960 RepID=UPI003075C1F0
MSRTSPLSRSRALRLPAILLAFALLVGAAAAAIVGVRSLERANGSLEHSYLVINLLVASEAALHEAESKARGYRLTGRESFRPEYGDAVARAGQYSRRLIELTADNPSQQALARTFDADMQRHLSTMEILLDPVQMAALPDDERQRRISDNVRRATAMSALRQQLMDEEARLLAERQVTSQQRATLLVVFIVLAFVVALGLLIFMLWSLSRENRRSRRLERDARNAMRDLHALSEQRHTQSEYAGMLQSCQSREEIVALTTRAVVELVPGASGRCYLARPSQNFLESAGTFGEHPISHEDTVTQDDCWALRRGQPHYLRGRSGGLRCAHIDRDVPLDGVSTLCVPLIAQGQSLGMLHVSAASDPSGSDNDASILASLSEQMALALANLQLRETLRTQSLRDPLTSLFNRRYLEVSLARELQRCERRQLPLSLMMLDVDHFKRFNDTHGHAAGDAVLSQVGRLIQAGVRTEDIACRYGGEEFTVVLPELDAANARLRAEQIRRAVEISSVQHMGQTLGPVTLSIGIATFPANGTTPELLLQVADATLYRAKAEGRNRVLHASQTD